MRARVICAVSLAVVLVGPPALADHTDPGEPLSSPDAQLLPGSPFETRGEGTWEHIANFAPNPGTDHRVFRAGRDWYAVAGTLGGQPAQHVGQRIVRLTRGGEVAPEFAADHGSAACVNGNPNGATGQQHDVAVAPAVNPKVFIDANDTTGRCHDPSGGGLEIVDISGIEREGFEPRELHLTRHVGTSHTVTVDATRPWIVYNSSSTFDGYAWVDVLDIRTCMGPDSVPLERKRERCRPKVYRIPFDKEWTQQRDWATGRLRPGTHSSCHDITAAPGRLYCAALNATLILDVSQLTDRRGNIRGRPMECEVIDGTDTTAKVTDCSMHFDVNPGTALPGDEVTNPDPIPAARGWRLLGGFNHAGRECAPPPEHVVNCNSHLFVHSTGGISISHEADPVRGGDYMLVTDERGGGIVPPGATCAAENEPGIGNGGAHVFDIRDPSQPRYALTPDGDNAVFVGEVLVPSATFCDIHVIQPITGEDRILAAYYSQGVKIVDYAIDRRGRWTFQETAAMALPGANTWAVSNFMTKRNPDGTRTYFFVATDVERGIDVYSWTGPANPTRSVLGRKAEASADGVREDHASLDLDVLGDVEVDGGVRHPVGTLRLALEKDRNLLGLQPRPQGIRLEGGGGDVYQDQGPVPFACMGRIRQVQRVALGYDTRSWLASLGPTGYGARRAI
jgi:hypothetical protein